MTWMTISQKGGYIQKQHFNMMISNLKSCHIAHTQLQEKGIEEARTDKE